MKTKKSRLSRVRKNRGNSSSLVNWQLHRIKKTVSELSTYIVE